MINQDEIKAKALEFDIHHSNVERDYVFGWFLKSIYENDYLRRRVVFKGGNCLRKAFYPETRFSTDLDFSVSSAIEVNLMAEHINNACRQAQSNCGVEFLIHRNTFTVGPRIDKERCLYKGRVFFTDFFGIQDDLTISIKVDVTEFDKLYLPTTTRMLIHPYSDADLCSGELICIALEELVASKLKCLIQRRHSHDLFDLVYSTFIDQSITLDRGLVLRAFLNKTIFNASPGAAKSILLGIPMTFFGEVWEKYIRCPKSTRFGFNRALEGFKDSIEKLFDGVMTGGREEQLYFRSEFRNLILEAGADRKLMKLTYDGRERVIEPYSLAYKQAAGKPACEYFYAYDTTGGHRSNPGIRSFLNPKVEALSITEEKFEPRYEIELSKAGEEVSKGYFGNAFKDTTRYRTSSRLGSIFGKFPKARSFRTPEKIYKVQCPYCLKMFKRKSQSLSLNEHKSPDGYRCNGRSGYRVL